MCLSYFFTIVFEIEKWNELCDKGLIEEHRRINYVWLRALYVYLFISDRW